MNTLIFAYTLAGVPVYIHASKFDQLCEQEDVISFTFSTRQDELGCVAQHKRTGKIVGLWLDFFEDRLVPQAGVK